jgi:hypothetical protein
MTNKRLIKDLLGNKELYAAEMTTAIGDEWKKRLLGRYAPDKKLVIATRDERSAWLPAASIALPILCIAVAVASYLGFIHPAAWLESIPTVNFKAPVIDWKEGLLFAAIVNAVTFLLKGNLSKLF